MNASDGKKEFRKRKNQRATCDHNKVSRLAKQFKKTGIFFRPITMFF